MLKLPKGLKKKKKSKKSKKDQELFTEEELEQYKREHQAPNQSQPVEDVEVTSDNDTKSSAPSEASKSEADDEWSKFKALTAGVDSILHKTQDDLDRIKSTSFFQRVPPPSEQKKAAEEEAAQREAERLEEERLKKEEEEANRDVLAEAVVELSESEEESEEADDIFDTDYIDAITSGEVQLGIVPDSPDFEIDDGPDPFDTSYADKLIKGPEVSKRGKKLVSIGSAVEVLTGRVDTVHSAGGIRRRPRRGPQNLLLDNFDDEAAAPAEAEVSVTPEPARTLLDDFEDDIPGELPPIDLSVSLHLSLQKQHAEDTNQEAQQLDIVSEFDIFKNDEDDEFAELAAESLVKKEEVKVLQQVQPFEFTGEVSSDWAEFETQPEEVPEQSTKVKPPRPPPARPTTGPQIATVQPENEGDFELPEDDPFDTTFVEKVLPGKDDEDDFDFDPRAEETKPAELKVERDLLGGSSTDLSENEPISNLLIVAQKDLLGTSTTDLSTLSQAPINPVQDLEEAEEDFDPFDTSAVTKLVQPKATELKFLEKELLTESSLKHSVSDPDFDPRADEIDVQSAEIPAQVAVDSARRKSSLSLNFQPKSVGFLVPDSDLLSIDNDAGKIQKPLTPYYSKEQVIAEKEAEDPFDTSFVPKSQPTQVELNLIEKDLLTSTKLQHSISDPDFDPRADDELEKTAVKSDLLGVENQIDTKVLTPSAESQYIDSQYSEYVDPFDTSSIAANILPGKTELKLIENELLAARTPTTVTGVLDTLTDAQELGLGDKVLTPQVPIAAAISEEEIDPFDTSFANNLGPGKAEIKIIETELIQN